MRHLPLSLALAFLAFAAVSSSFAPRLLQAWNTPESYRELRNAQGFNTMNIEALRSRLDACLPASQSVAFGPQMLADGLLMQRLTELFYPRIVDRTSPFTLERMDRSRVDPATMVPLGSLGNNQAELVLLGTCAPGAPRDSVEFDRPRLALPRLLVSVAGAWGFGLFTLALAARLLRRNLEPGAVWVAGAVVLALLTAGATFLQAGLSWTVLRGVGIVLGAATLVATRARWMESLRALPGRLRRRPEALLAATLLVAFTLRMAVWPMTAWDGRSIWLFNARRIVFHGMFSRADLVHLDSLWSHSSYPLLLPGWLAFFGSDGPSFNERSAGISLGLLLAGLLGLLWKLSREQLGRWVGCAFTLGAFFSVQTLCSWSYADGFLGLLLVIQVLGLSSSRFRAEGWLAACAAVMTKQEGALLAQLFALTHVALQVIATPTWSRRAREALPLLLLLPARLYIRWVDTLEIAGDFTHPNWAGFIAHPFQRLATILGAYPAAARLQPVLVPGLVGALVAAAFVPGWLRRNPGARALPTLAPLFGVAFAVGVFLVTPSPLEWHLASAFDRVLVHASLLFVCVALLSTASQGEGLSTAVPENPAQDLRPERSRDAA